MSERTWQYIENEIREDYLRADGPENVQFREVQWDVWLAEVKRKEAEKVWDHAFRRFEMYTTVAPENPQQGTRLFTRTGRIRGIATAMMTT